MSHLYGLYMFKFENLKAMGSNWVEVCVVYSNVRFLLCIQGVVGVASLLLVDVEMYDSAGEDLLRK